MVPLEQKSSELQSGQDFANYLLTTAQLKCQKLSGEHEK